MLLSPDSGGLMMSWGKTAECELSGDGGLLLTSLNVERVSIASGAMDKEEGGTMSSGPAFNLHGFKSRQIENVHMVNY